MTPEIAPETAKSATKKGRRKALGFAGAPAPEKLERALVKKNPAVWFELHACILDKLRKELKSPALRVNEMQAEIDDIIRFCEEKGIPCRIVTLKGRQQGSSTFSIAVAYHMCRASTVKCCIIGDEYEKSVANLVAMFDTFAEKDHFDWGSKYAKTSKKFTNGSMLMTETANDPRAGASGTMQCVIATEVAHWKETGVISGKSTFAALLNCVPEAPGTLIIVESTPNGVGGVYHSTYVGAISLEDYKAGRIPKNWNGFFKVFYPWHRHPGYRLDVSPDQAEEINTSLTERESELIGMGLGVDRLAWRRKMIASPRFDGEEDIFEQEYPSDEERCLTADARVGTSNGIVPISEVAVGSVTDHGVVVAKKSMGIKPVVRLTTKSGYSIRCTGNHRFAVGDSFERADKLLGQEITLQIPVTANIPHVVRWRGFAGVESSLEINEVWGAFLGYFAGDGSFGGAQLSLVVDRKDQDLAETISAIVSQIIGRDPGQRFVGPNDGAVEIRVSDNRLREVFEELGIIQEGKNGTIRKICVPECIWKSPKPVIRQFLKFLFEADGWTSHTVPKVKFFTKHLEFARDVQRLLLIFGIRIGIHEVVRSLNGSKFPGFEMAMTSVDSRKFMDEIGFASRRKNSGSAASYEPGEAIAARYNYRDEVISVVPDGEEEVWDIQIEGSAPVFGANGILVHNCFLMSGRRAFPLPQVQAMRKRIKLAPEPEYGILQWRDDTKRAVSFQLCDPDESWLKVWERPTPGYRYNLPIDPMTGASSTAGDDPDNHGAGIMRAGIWDKFGHWLPTKLAARLADCWHEKRHKRGLPVCKWDIDVLEERAVQLSFWYGGATIVPEVNMDRGLIELMKQRTGVNIYRRQVINRTRQQMTDQYGWQTNTVTRGAMIEHLVRRVRIWDEPGDGIRVLDDGVISELGGMIVKPNGRSEAMGGYHDDQVMMLAIGLSTIEAAHMMPPERKSAGGGWEDYETTRQDTTYS